MAIETAGNVVEASLRNMYKDNQEQCVTKKEKTQFVSLAGCNVMMSKQGNQLVLVIDLDKTSSVTTKSDKPYTAKIGDRTRIKVGERQYVCGLWLKQETLTESKVVSL